MSLSQQTQDLPVLVLKIQAYFFTIKYLFKKIKSLSTIHCTLTTGSSFLNLPVIRNIIIVWIKSVFIRILIIIFLSRAVNDKRFSFTDTFKSVNYHIWDLNKHWVMFPDNKFIYFLIGRRIA